MDILTHNDGLAFEDCAKGTSFKGEIDCEYDKLVDLFGEPMEGDGYKVDAEWYINATAVIDGVEEIVYFTIYNWKNGVAYNGDPRFNSDSKYVSDITNWHIGAKVGQSHIVHSILNKILI